MLAHAHRDALEDLLDSVRTYVPGAEVVVFNGGTDPDLTAGLDVADCSYSRPLRIGNLVPFHWGVMRWLADGGVDYDFLVTVDWDVLFVRDGLAAQLERTMAESAFMGAGYLVVAPEYPHWDCARRINYGWDRWWRPLFGTEHPSWAFNPGLAFRREYAERALRFDRLPQILARAARSRIYGIEEWVYATLAVSLECNPLRNPGSAALQNRHLSASELDRALVDPDVFVVHKIGRELDAPDRLALRSRRRNGPTPVSGAGGAEAGSTEAGSSCVPFGAGPPLGPAAGGSGTPPPWRARLREGVKDAYFRVLP